MLNTEPVRVSHSVRAHPHVPKTIRIRRTKRANGPAENTGLLISTQLVTSRSGTKRSSPAL